MALAPGTRLGPYEITAQIGVGGMGEVYRATDTNLARQVAIKVLPEAVANNAERLARFDREAKTLAALNHPGIAQIYGLEKSDGRVALVMELVEGPTLADRIAQGPIPVADALPIAKQIAEALEAAHEQGIIHRDLKPANVKVRKDGAAKVLDFGLAKVMEPVGGGSWPDVTHSPTVTSPAMTQAGMILGTAAYMSPEQAKGRSADKRSDIWAFGAVLYEMFTGRRAFAGGDVSDTMASVLAREPEWSLLPQAVSPVLEAYLRRCLQKDRRQRIGDIHDVRLALDGAFEAPVPVATSTPAPTSPGWGRVLPWAVAGVLGVALISALVLWAPWRSTPAPTPRKLLARIGADASLSTNPDSGASAILSPDGTTLAFVAVPTNQTASVLFVRKLDGDLQATALAGTAGAASPFFSPDGQWIAYFAGGRLKKVSTASGASLVLCDAPTGRGGAWTDDNTIIFTAAGNGPNSRLMRVPDAGGTPVQFGSLGAGAVTQRWPQALPDGRSVLYTESSDTSDYDAANLVVAPLSGGDPKVVISGGSYGRYVAPPTPDEREGGHLIYVNQGTLLAVRFDLDRLETVGPPVPAVEDIPVDLAGGAQVALSSDGTLVCLPGAPVSSSAPIDWLTHGGKRSVLRAAKADWGNPRFSPDGKKLAMDISDGKQRDVWVYEIARDTLTQITFDAANDSNPVWTPDGRHIVFGSDRAKAGVDNLYWVNADGPGEVTRLTDSPNYQRPFSWHPNGRFLAFSEGASANLVDLMVLPMNGDATRGWTPGTPTAFLSRPVIDITPAFSPHGRFIAYASIEAGGGQFDIYVRPFPGPGGPRRVSTTSGAYPRWSATTHELLFLNYLESKIMAAPYAVVGDSFQVVGTPKVWSPISVRGGGATNSGYDLHPDGQRVAAAAVVDRGETVQDQVVFFFNFAEYLAKIAPGKE